MSFKQRLYPFSKPRLRLWIHLQAPFLVWSPDRVREARSNCQNNRGAKLARAESGAGAGAGAEAVVSKGALKNLENSKCP